MKNAATIIFLAFLINGYILHAQVKRGYNAIYSGTTWFDDKGQPVSAHGGCIIKDGGHYYLFGEKHTDTSNAFAGFNCYSSADLYNWKFESTALPVQKSGKMGPGSVGERVKVMKCPATKEYVMYMHADTLGYTDQFVGYAVSKKIAGPYVFKGALLFNGKPVKKWDMGTFQDKDGNGYILLHGGDIYKLGDDYKSITEQVNKSFTPGFESPAIFRKDNIYYFLGSNLTSWEKNDNYYFTATSLKGPWTPQGLFCPEGTLTWNSQTTFVFPIEGTKDTTYMFMGDRWSYPKQASAATYVWQPFTISGTSLSIPRFQEAWQVDTSSGVAAPFTFEGKTVKNNDTSITYNGDWNHIKNDILTGSVSGEKNNSFSVKFTGRQICLYGLATTNGGYAGITMQNSKGETIFTSVIDMYAKYEVPFLRFISPILPKGSYSLTVSVMGERANWSDKRKSNYGSTGNFVSLDKLVIQE